MFMTPLQKNRFYFLIGVLLLASSIVVLIISAFYTQISFFITPTSLKKEYVGRIVRLGGYVQKGSFKDLGVGYTFNVTDDVTQVSVSFKGPLPPLFKEGQGVVLEGTYQDDNIFYATQVFAKHDETYMPQSVVQELKEKGQWKKSY
jgi:cytochrome c-type biogenesis protein CcmE